MRPARGHQAVPTPFWPDPGPIQTPLALVAIEGAGTVDRSLRIGEEVANIVRVQPSSRAHAGPLEEVVPEISFEAQRTLFYFTVHPERGVHIDALAPEAAGRPLAHRLGRVRFQQALHLRVCAAVIVRRLCITFGVSGAAYLAVCLDEVFLAPARALDGQRSYLTVAQESLKTVAGGATPVPLDWCGVDRFDTSQCQSLLVPHRAIAVNLSLG